jgi:AcrR family transcriptional regulator
MNLEVPQDRRQHSRALARRVILDATESLLLEGGYENLSMRRLAERCGCAAPTIYHYFGDKERLVGALLEERFAELVAGLEGVPQSADPVENLRALCLAFWRFGVGNPTHYRLVMLPSRVGEAPVVAAERARDILEGPIHELASAGRLSTSSTLAFKQSLWALLHGVISLQGSRPDHPWHPDLMQTALAAMLRGGAVDADPEASGHASGQE